MSAFPNSKLDAELVNKAVASLLKYESKKAAGSNGKKALLSGYAKPVLVQVLRNSAPVFCYWKLISLFPIFSSLGPAL